MATPYRPTSWGNEYVSAEKLNIMSANDQYLFEQTPTVYYNGYGLSKKSGGMKIASGVVVIPANTSASSVMKDYHFGNFFSQGCRPIVTTSLSMGPGGRYHCIVGGFGRMTPDHRGMRIRILANSWTASTSRINTKIYVNWIAVGW